MPDIWLGPNKHLLNAESGNHFPPSPTQPFIVFFKSFNFPKHLLNVYILYFPLFVCCFCACSFKSIASTTVHILSLKTPRKKSLKIWVIYISKVSFLLILSPLHYQLLFCTSPPLASEIPSV